MSKHTHRRREHRGRYTPPKGAARLDLGAMCDPHRLQLEETTNAGKPALDLHLETPFVAGCQFCEVMSDHAKECHGH